MAFETPNNNYITSHFSVLNPITYFPLCSMIVPGYKYAIEPNVILFVCTIECCFEKVKLDYRQKCKISIIFQIVVIQRAKVLAIYSG